MFVAGKVWLFGLQFTLAGKINLGVRVPSNVLDGIMFDGFW